MPYEDNEQLELQQRRIDAMEQALLIARGTPRDAAAELIEERKRLQDAYRGDPGINPVPGVWINPEGEDLEGDVPRNRQEAIQTNAIARDLLGDDFSTDTQWNVKHFADKNTPASDPADNWDDWEELPQKDNPI